MSERDERVEALANLFAEHAADGSDEQKIDGEWVWGFDCDCGEFVPFRQCNEHLAMAVLTSPAMRDLLAEAWDEGSNAVCPDPDRCWCDDVTHSPNRPKSPNPYRQEAR